MQPQESGNTHWKKLLEKGAAVLYNLRTRLQSQAWMKRGIEQVRPLLTLAWWQVCWEQLLAWSKKTLHRIRSFSWRKEDIQAEIKGLESKARAVLNRETLQEKAKQVKDKAQELGEKAKPLADQAQARAQALHKQSGPLSENAREKAKELSQKSKDLSSEAKMRLLAKVAALREEKGTPSGPIPENPLVSGLVWAGKWPFLQRWLEWWINLPIFRSEKLLNQFLLPTLLLSSLILLSSGICLYLYFRSNLNLTEEELRIEATQSLKDQIYQKYGTHVAGLSATVEQHILDNSTTSEIVADAPTFQELDIQKMEAFSRSLLRKDTNLLNVVVLTSEAVKRNIRTRRIGDTTRFLFTCCELPASRAISYAEIDEKSWMATMDDHKSAISDIFVNPINGEKYFYHASTIEDIKSTQLGTVLLRYNLNFAIRALQQNLSGNNYLVANDSLIVATSQDTIYPNIRVASYADTNRGRPVDYIFVVIDQIRQAATPQEAVMRLRKGAFIRDPALFEQQFTHILPGKLPDKPILEEDGEYWLSEEQALAILDLSFGQLLGLKKNRIGVLGSSQLSAGDGSILALAYLDSMRQAKQGVIVDDDYLISFATNQFGWLMVNQSSNTQYMAPIIAKNHFIVDRFRLANSRIFWFVMGVGLFVLFVFVVVTSGFVYRFTIPINKLATRIAEVRKVEGVSLEDQDGLTFIGDSIDAMEAELVEYIAKLEASNQDLDQYAHLVAHDLREPLRAINSYIELLVNKHRTDFDEDSLLFVEFIQDGAKRMDAMVKNLLQYSKLSQKLESASWVKVDLNDQVQLALANLNQLMEDNEVNLVIAELPTVTCKAAMLTMVFQNLIENAIKYRQPDVPLTIEISAEEHEQEWHIGVKDNGVGISVRMQSKVFQMFSRISPQDTQDGSGIGLASSRKIITYNGGKIWVESEGKNKGSCFMFSLPKRELPASAQPAVAASNEEG